MLGTPPNAGVQMSSILVTPTTPTPTSVKPSSNFQTYEGKYPFYQCLIRFSTKLFIFSISLGQLNKFTNVVKGWQYRWFVLTPETGNLEYYLMDEGKKIHHLLPIQSILPFYRFLKKMFFHIF